MSDNIEFSPAARWEHLKEDGPKLLVDLSSNDLINNKPKWLNEERFALAKKAINKYYLGISYSSLTGLLLILQLPDGLEPLLVTGNSKDIPSLYRRYLSTALHVKSWYEDDIFDSETKGYKSIRQVRAMHRRVQQLMNERFQVKDLNGRPRLWMTQYDVALTQFAFVGLAMLYPEKSAMIAATHDDLELINYYWRVLGWMMGMKDEFNLCQFDKYADIREFNRLILEEGYKNRYKEQPCEKGLEMTKAICTAMHYFTPLVTFNSLAYWWRDCFQFNGYQQKPLSLKEKFLNMTTRLSFNCLLKSPILLDLSTNLQRKQFQKRLGRKDKVYESLKKHHQGCPYTSFFSDRVDYFGKNKISSPDGTQTKIEENGLNDKNNGKKEAAMDNCNNDNDEKITKNKRESDKPLDHSTTVFQGCPLGFDTILPALNAIHDHQALITQQQNLVVA